MGALLMIACNDQNDINESRLKGFFSDKDTVGFYEWCNWSVEKGLEGLVFRVSRNPRYLHAHIERIYYCFQQNLGEQLFGALVDLLIVLNGDGDALGRRMVIGSKSRVTENQFHVLTNHIDNRNSRSDLLPPNRYSIFAKGLQSATVMVQMTEGVAKEEYDPLVLARDYIEFSQLDSAIHILEQAILAQPERMELHDELLSIYRSTRNEAGFNRIYEELSRKALSLPPEWKQLNDFFIRLRSDEK